MRRSVRILLALAMLLLGAGCSRQPAPSDPVPPHTTFTIASAILGEERVINVFLPPAAAGSTTALPVVYMPDGGVQEDFPHIANTLAELVAAGEIAPVILVGIENTARRRDLTGPTTVESDRRIAPVVGGSAAFRAFIAEELMPAVAARYRVTDDRTIIGESAAALFIVETFFLQPDLFDRWIAISPALWWNDHELSRRAAVRLAERRTGPQRLYLTCADETDIVPWVEELAAALRTAAPADLAWTYDPRPQEKHTTIFRATKADGFRAVLR